MDRHTLVAISLVTLPLVFVWHLELIFPITVADAGTISSGFLRFEGRNAYRFYHISMYALFLVSWIAAYLLATD